MKKQGESRRRFLLSSMTGLSAAWIAANEPGILAAQEHMKMAAKAGQAPRLGYFTDAQAAEVEAIAAQIIPADETPGAKEARCIYFIDRALTTFDKSKQPIYVDGLRELQSQTQSHFPQAGKFSALSSEQQIQLLTQIEKTPFFRTVRTHTVLGFF